MKPSDKAIKKLIETGAKSVDVVQVGGKAFLVMSIVGQAECGDKETMWEAAMVTSPAGDSVDVSICYACRATAVAFSGGPVPRPVKDEVVDIARESGAAHAALLAIAAHPNSGIKDEHLLGLKKEAVVH